MSFDVFDDYECEGQLNLNDMFDVELPESIFAVSKIFARARKQMNLAEYKTFVFALTQIKFKQGMPTYVYLDKKTVAKLVGVDSDINHLSSDLKRSIGELPKHSFLSFEDKDKDIYDSGCFVTRITMLKNMVRIKFEEDYLKLFSNLENNYITMWSTDIFNMKSERSIDFYENLRLNSDTRVTNSRGYGIKFFKELFDIPKTGKGSYMRKDGHFDRPSFERRVLEPLCEDLNKCKMINLVRQDDGRYYQKVKKNGRVLGYRFEWNICERPQIATALEKKEIQEQIDKNPEVLKIAKDIVKGNKKPKKENKNSFNNFNQREYDIDELERALLNNSLDRKEE